MKSLFSDLKLQILLALLLFATGASGSTLGTIYANSLSGSDLGAQINTAVSVCGSAPCSIVATSGTIATSPDIPRNFHLTLLPGNYTLSTTWFVQHQSAVYDLTDAVINYTGNISGQPAIFIGKNITSGSTISTSGTAVTWVSGSLFTDIDPQDTLIIPISGMGATYYQVASVTDSKHLTLATSAGTQTGVTYAVDIVNAVPSGNSPGYARANLLTVNGLNLTIGTGDTSGSAAITMQAVDGFVLNGPTVTCNAATTNLGAFLLQGAEDGSITNSAISNCALAVYTALFSLTANNEVHFVGGTWSNNTNPYGEATVYVQQDSANLEFRDITIGQGNTTTSTYGVFYIDNSSYGSKIIGNWFEGNVGYSGGYEILNEGWNTDIEDNLFSATGANSPWGFILSSGTAASGTTIKGNVFNYSGTGTPSNIAYSFASGASGVTINNYIVSGMTFTPPALALDHGAALLTEAVYTGTTPTCTSTGFGTGYTTCSISTTGSNDNIGVMVATAQSTASSSGTFVLNFHSSLGTHYAVCTFNLGNTNTGVWNARATAIFNLNALSTGSATVLWDNNGVALTSGDVYGVAYSCAGM